MQAMSAPPTGGEHPAPHSGDALRQAIAVLREHGLLFAVPSLGAAGGVAPPSAPAAPAAAAPTLNTAAGGVALSAPAAASSSHQPPPPEEPWQEGGMIEGFGDIVSGVLDLSVVSDRRLEALLKAGGDEGETALLGMATMAQATIHDKWPGAADETDEEHELREAMDKGLNLSTGLGQRFQRAVRAARQRKDTTEFDDYKGTNQQKAEFRAQWVKRKYEEVTSKRVASRSWCQVDFSKVEYRPFDYILREQGGRHSVAAVRATTTLVKKAILMGPPFWKKHPLTERIEFAHMVQGFDTKFERAWHLFQEEVAVEGARQKALKDKKRALAIEDGNVRREEVQEEASKAPKTRKRAKVAS